MSSVSTTPLLSLSATDPSQAKPKKIHEAAQQFESLLIGEMLKSAHPSDSEGWLGSGESTGDDSAMDMAESQLANALTKGGGLGLAKIIERDMTKATSQNTSQNTADTAQASSAGSLKKP